MAASRIDQILREMDEKAKASAAGIVPLSTDVEDQQKEDIESISVTPEKKPIFAKIQRLFVGRWHLDPSRSSPFEPLSTAKQIPTSLARVIDSAAHVTLRIHLQDKLLSLRTKYKLSDKKSSVIVDDRSGIEANGPWTSIRTFYGTVERYRIRWDPDSEVLETECKLLDETKGDMVFETYTVLDNCMTLCHSCVFQSPEIPPGPEFPIKRYYTRPLDGEIEQDWEK